MVPAIRKFRFFFHSKLELHVHGKATNTPKAVLFLGSEEKLCLAERGLRTPFYGLDGISGRLVFDESGNTELHLTYSDKLYSLTVIEDSHSCAPKSSFSPLIED